MPKYPMLLGTKIHTLMLDTTYCTPRWAFPPQQEAVASAIAVARTAREDKPGELLTHNYPESWSLSPLLLMSWHPPSMSPRVYISKLLYKGGRPLQVPSAVLPSCHDSMSDESITP